MKTNNITKPYKRPINGRRKRALERAEAYLKAGGYPMEKGFIKLTDKRKAELQKEIAALKERIVS